MGGLGLRSACSRRHVCCWAIWADVLQMIRLRHTFVAESMLAGLASNHPGHHLQVTATARSRLEDMGFRTPEWGALARGLRPEGFPVEEEVGPRHVGWQRVATVDANNFFKVTVWPRLNVAARAFLRSQGGPLAGLPFVCCPTSFHTRLEAQVFRVLLLRRLWLPLPPIKRICGVAVFSTLLAPTVQHAQLWE